jgi:chemotaxis protein MotB
MDQQNKNNTQNDLTVFIEDPTETSSASWVITFSDLMTLLLAFFVLLYSMSIIDIEKFTAMSGSLKKAHGLSTESNYRLVPEENTIETEAVQNLLEIENTKLEEILKNVNAYIFQNNLQNIVKAYIDERGVAINISDSVLFRAGDDNLTAQSKGILNYLMELFQSSTYPLLIEGHTDNTPINTIRFPSNWELSALRASNVVKYFIINGISPERLSAEGFAEHRPIASNNTESGRAINRRIEIVFKRSGIISMLSN